MTGLSCYNHDVNGRKITRVSPSHLSIKTLLPALLVVFWGAGMWLAPAPVSAAAADYLPGSIILGLADGVEPADLTLPRGASWGRTSEGMRALHAVRVSVPAGQESAFIQAFSGQVGVLFAEYNYRVRAAAEPTDPRYGEQYALPAIRAPQAWDVATGSASVVVAVLDSGIDAGHPEFVGRISGGYDFVQRDSIPQDTCGHGTHVSGIIAANASNGQGVAGVDWAAKIMPVRVLDGQCSGSVDALVDGLVYAANRGAQVINLSLGMPDNPAGTNSRLLGQAVYYAYSRGSALFAAAGNRGSTGIAFIPYPAVFPWVMAVGATNAANLRADFSVTGAQLDLMAPGDAILSTVPHRGSFTYQQTHGLGNSYGLLSGTSMATAYASGAAALLASQSRFDRPAEIYQALQNTALDLGSPGWDHETGHGLIQLDGALAYDPGEDPLPEAPDPLVEYDVLQSRHCANPELQFQWVDIPHDVAHVVVLPSPDQYRQVTLPFAFNYGGADYSQAVISENGYLAFDPPPALYNQPVNFLMPFHNNPENGLDEVLAPFWDNLDAVPAPSPSGVNQAVYAALLPATGTTPARYVVEWYRMRVIDFVWVGGAERKTMMGQVTFQLILEEGTNRIIYQYRDLSGARGDGSSATVGLEYNQGFNGVQIAYNQRGAVQAGTAVHFFPRAAGSLPVNTPGCTQSENVTDPQAVIWADPFCLDLNGLLPANPTRVTITPMRRFGPAAAWKTYLSLDRFAEISLDPNPRPPLNPAPQVCYTYTAQDVLTAGGRAGNLFFAVYDDDTRTWESLPTQADVNAGRIYADAPHFSVYGVFAPRQPEELPVTGADLE